MKNKVDSYLEKPLVSIIIPTYRRDTSLIKALISLTNQTYSNIEVILIDDNCDESWNLKVKRIVEQTLWINKKNFIYIVNEKNEGSAKSRNIGIQNSTGFYVSFLDDDDVYTPYKIEKQLKSMVRESSDYSLTDLWLYNEKQELIEKRIRKNLNDNLLKEELLKIHFMYHLTGTNVLMFKRKYLIEIGGFDPVDVGDEFYLMQKAIEHNGKFSYLPGCEVISIVHYDSPGLSSGEGKIKGEKVLFNYKKSFFYKFDRKTINYIKMRHYAVLSFAEFRRRNRRKFFVFAFKSFIHSPVQSFQLFFERNKK